MSEATISIESIGAFRCDLCNEREPLHYVRVRNSQQQCHGTGLCRACLQKLAEVANAYVTEKPQEGLARLLLCHKACRGIPDDQLAELRNLKGMLALLESEAQLDYVPSLARRALAVARGEGGE